MFKDSEAACMSYMLKNCCASFEFAQEMSWRGQEAIEKRNLGKLYGEALIFKPDDGTTETFSKKDVAWIIEHNGFADFVDTIIQENELREMLTGQFGYLSVEECIKGLAMKAINECDISHLVKDICVLCYDQGTFNYEIKKEELTERLEKNGILDYVKYRIWLKNHR